MDGRYKADMSRTESVAVKPEENTVTRSKQRGAFGVTSGEQYTAGLGVDADCLLACIGEAVGINADRLV